MSWLSTILTAIVSATIGTAASGYFANLAVRWYRVSPFEGGSGYFVVGLALCGLVAGLVIGLVISRIVAASAQPSVVIAMLYSATATSCVIGAIGGVARLLADIPPTIDGENVMLLVEARWPATRVDSPASMPGVAYLDLGAATTFRRPEPKRGALWKEDARQVDGRWTVIGAAPMFTSRGTPTIEIALNKTEQVSFTLPPLAHPTAADGAWSAWYPTDGKGGPTLNSGVTYRYRVQKLSVPVRTENIGNFEVSAIVSYFKPVDTEGVSTVDFYGSFRILFRGKPLSAAQGLPGNGAGDEARMVAVLPSATTALLAAVNGEWTLLSEESGKLRQQRIGSASDTPPAELTNDPVRMKETRVPQDPRGRVDRTTYSRSHLLLFDHAVLNVDTREVHTFTAKSDASLIPSVPPLGVSPDAQSFVRFVLQNLPVDGEYPPMLAVTDFIRNVVYEIPIDRARMPYRGLENLDAEWLSRSFVWKRNAMGVDKLEVRVAKP